MGVLSLALLAAELVLWSVGGCGMLVVGARRWVKIVVAAALADAIALTAVNGGAIGALGFLALLATVTTTMMVLGLRSWRTARELTYDVAPPVRLPEHAADDVNRWTRELSALGFEPTPMISYRWRAQGEIRTTLMQFYRHATLPCAASIYVIARPKALGRSVTSRLADGRWLRTFDRMSDSMLLPDPSQVTQRVASGETTERLLAVHAARLAALGADPTAVHDPVAYVGEAREAWIAGLIASGDAAATGGDVMLRPSAMPKMIARTWVGWFR